MTSDDDEDDSRLQKIEVILVQHRAYLDDLQAKLDRLHQFWETRAMPPGLDEYTKMPKGKLTFYPDNGTMTDSQKHHQPGRPILTEDQLRRGQELVKKFPPNMYGMWGELCDWIREVTR